ncbi:hypothetical protein HYW11_02235 [Candidatus Peregrinibacteria bacterium]|nr:hypothetical protein [Candidatus Peregrinibacteria bacterium]
MRRRRIPHPDAIEVERLPNANHPLERAVLDRRVSVAPKKQFIELHDIIHFPVFPPKIEELLHVTVDLETRLSLAERHEAGKRVPVLVYLRNELVEDAPTNVKSLALLPPSAFLLHTVTTVPHWTPLRIHGNLHHFINSLRRKRMNGGKRLGRIIRIRMMVASLRILHRNSRNDRMYWLIQVPPRLTETLLLLLERNLRIVDRHEPSSSLDELQHRIKILTREFLGRNERLETFRKTYIDHLGLWPLGRRTRNVWHKGKGGKRK